MTHVAFDTLRPGRSGAYSPPPLTPAPATAHSAPPRPTLVSVPAPERRALPTALVVALLVAAALVPRAALFAVNENYFGDAVMRTELAERWLVHPRWLSSFQDGAYQFGPAHLYALAGALAVWPEREHAGRAVSLLFGALTVVPLFFLSRRLFGARAARAACLAFCPWGMHLQLSTTAASEAFSLFLVLCALAAFARAYDGASGARWLALCALWMNAACATRYDAWMLIPLLCAALAWGRGKRGVLQALLFGVLCAPFPLVWMVGNAQASGDPLFPIHFIDAYHRRWWGDGAATFGALGYRLQNAVFWPWVALLTLTPGVAALAMVGLASSARSNRPGRWLAWLVLLPTAYFTLRGAVLATFAPLGRFAALQIVLLLPFLEPGYRAVARWLPRPGRAALVAGSALLAVALPAWLGAFTFRAEGKFEDWLRPVSPTSTNPPALMAAARAVKQEVSATGEALVVDSDRQYLDLQLAFFTGLPEARMARYRWENFPHILAAARPRYLALFQDGALVREGRVTLDGARARFEGANWVERPLGPGPVRLFVRE